MQKPDRSYIIVGLIWLLIGTVFGAWLGATQHMNFAESHAHLNLLGFVVSTLFGLIYWAYPKLANSKLALWQFITYEVGIVILLLGKVMVDADGTATPLLSIGSSVTIIGVALMLYLFAAKGRT